MIYSSNTFQVVKNVAVISMAIGYLPVLCPFDLLGYYQQISRQC